MMKKILISVIGLVLLINLMSIVSVSAITNDEVSYFYPHGSPFDIKRECFYNGAHCNQTIFMCFLTVFAPNQTTILNNTQMQGQINYYNKTVPYTDWPNGFYRSVMSCSDGTNSGSEVFYFKINPTGDNRTDSLFLILAFGSVIILGLAFLMQNDYIAFISGTLWITLGIYTLIFGFSSITDLYTRTIGYVSLGLGMIFIIYAGYKIAEDTNFSESAGGMNFKDGFE